MKDLLRHVETEHVLLIQWDGYVVNPEAWRDDFLDHDYIGARWGFHEDAHCVGNGGFSLRSRRLLEALQDPAIDRFEPEDEMICRHYRPMLESRYGMRFAPPEVADRFSFETTYPQGRPLGFHGLFNMWLFLDDAEVADFVAAMPRSVLGSIQFLSLAKNFIDLKRFGSARILLEQRLRAFPADAKCSRDAGRAERSGWQAPRRAGESQRPLPMRQREALQALLRSGRRRSRHDYGSGNESLGGFVKASHGTPSGWPPGRRAERLRSCAGAGHRCDGGTLSRRARHAGRAAERRGKTDTRHPGETG